MWLIFGLGAIVRISYCTALSSVIFLRHPLFFHVPESSMLFCIFLPDPFYLLSYGAEDLNVQLEICILMDWQDKMTDHSRNYDNRSSFFEEVYATWMRKELSKSI